MYTRCIVIVRSFKLIVLFVLSFDLMYPLFCECRYHTIEYSRFLISVIVCKWAYFMIHRKIRLRHKSKNALQDLDRPLQPSPSNIDRDVSLGDGNISENSYSSRTHGSYPHKMRVLEPPMRVKQICHPIFPEISDQYLSIPQSHMLHVWHIYLHLHRFG